MNTPIAREMRLFLLVVCALSAFAAVYLLFGASQGAQDAQDTQDAQDAQDAVECVTGEWSEWSPACEGCDANGVPKVFNQTRTRTLLSGTPGCALLEETRPCEYTCPGTGSTCEYGAKWSEWTECSSECNPDGTPKTLQQTRYKNPLVGSSEKCQPKKQTRPCPTPKCEPKNRKGPTVPFYILFGNWFSNAFSFNFLRDLFSFSRGRGPAGLGG